MPLIPSPLSTDYSSWTSPTTNTDLFGSYYSTQIISAALAYHHGRVIESNRVVWYHHGVKHREGGPAIEWDNGTKEWMINGRHHRVDGPAIEHANGLKEWYLNGNLHRDNDLPAYEMPNGDFYYVMHGAYHRSNGPAIKSGSRLEYWVKGKRHREDGPAIIWPDRNRTEWYLNGRHLADIKTQDQFQRHQFAEKYL